MTENRRLFIDQNRLNAEKGDNEDLIITSSESHYLFRVMRMRIGDFITIIDGKGHLWKAKIETEKVVRLTTGFESPLLTETREKALICLAVAIPKKGFDNVLQMC